MIELKEISYVRFGTPDLQLAESFATSCLGLAVGDRSKKSLYLRSDDPAHTLCYTEGNPDEQAVDFEEDSEENLHAAAAKLEALGHPAHGGCAHARSPLLVDEVVRVQVPHGQSFETA